MLRLILLLISLLAPGFSSEPLAQEKGNVEAKFRLPPEMAGWKWDGKEKSYDSRTVFQYINGAAELYLAYGFRGLRVWRYEKAGTPAIVVEKYELASPEDAYGVFSYEQQDEPAGIGQGSEFGGGLLRFWKGRYFVSVYAEGEGPGVEEAILGLGRGADGAIPAEGEEPAIVRLLPGKSFGRIEKSTRYLKSHVLLNQRFFISHENILSLSRRTEAVLAAYSRDPQKVHLLLIRYPAPEDAASALNSFKKAYLPEAGQKDRLKTEDKKWTFARRQGEYLLLVFSSPTESDAEALLRAILDLGDGEGDPLTSPRVLARAIALGLLDAPHLRGNPCAAGRLVTRLTHKGVNAVDPGTGRVITERERLKALAAALDTTQYGGRR